MEQLFQALENYLLGDLISMSNLGLAQIETLIDLKKSNLSILKTRKYFRFLVVTFTLQH